MDLHEALPTVVLLYIPPPLLIPPQKTVFLIFTKPAAS